MLPAVSDDLQQDFEYEELPTRTYGLGGGILDGLEAVKQAVWMILHTERYQHIIYGWDYGVELQDLVGQPEDYVMAVLPSRIEEALLQDDRITAVESMEFVAEKGAVHAAFTVRSIFGEIESEVTV